MFFKFPKNDKNFIWTDHSKSKMLQYRLSEQKIKTILNNPERTETGVAPKTAAVMKRNDTPKRKEEMWVMYQLIGSEKLKAKSEKFLKRKKIISVWRYPGISPKREIPIPEGLLEEISQEISP